MNESVVNVVCFEWSVMNGLLWTGLFWLGTEKHAAKSFEIIKAIIDEGENSETMCGTEVLLILDWWSMSFIFFPNLILVMILFFNSLQMVCLDENDNCVEMVRVSCQAHNQKHPYEIPLEKCFGRSCKVFEIVMKNLGPSKKTLRDLWCP